MSTPPLRHSSGAGQDKPSSLHDSARASPEPPLHDGFHSLVDQINRILGPSDGIDSATVAVEDLKRAMASYSSDEPEWSRYAFGNAEGAYTRNLVDGGNGKANLLILVWTPGRSSPVHDHANAHCVMKVLKGVLDETTYGFPCEVGCREPVPAMDVGTPSPQTEHRCCRTCSSSSSPSTSVGELPLRARKRYTTDQVTYMSDRLGLHSVGNPSNDPNDFAVSLHLYTPPNAADHGCHTYDAGTGKKSARRYKMNHFYSEYGVRMEA